MREKLTLELAFLVAIMPVYVREAKEAADRMNNPKYPNAAADFARALAELHARDHLMKFINRMLAEED